MHTWIYTHTYTYTHTFVYIQYIHLYIIHVKIRKYIHTHILNLYKIFNTNTCKFVALDFSVDLIYFDFR